MTGINQNIQTSGTATVTLTGDAAVGDVASGKTFYNTDANTRLTGTSIAGVPQTRTINVVNAMQAHIAYQLVDFNDQPITQATDGTPFRIRLTATGNGNLVELACRLTGSNDELQRYYLQQLDDGNEIVQTLVQYEDVTWHINDNS